MSQSTNFQSCQGTFSWVEPVLSNEDKASWSRTQNSVCGEAQIRDPSISSLGLYHLTIEIQYEGIY